MENRLRLTSEGDRPPAFDLTAFKSLVYPSLCYYCRKPVHPDAVLCRKCFGDIEQVDRYELLEDLDHIISEGLFSDIFVKFFFDKFGPLRKLHQYLKYENRPYIGTLLGDDLAASLPETWTDYLDPLVIPVPVHRLRLLERGYNQSAYIAEGFASKLCIACVVDAVSRVAYARTQIGLSHEERQRNLTDAFSVDKVDTIRGKDVIIVDDIVTTGATASHLAVPLLEAGARTVRLAAVGFTRPC
ncbi:MAG: ComF family protein [Rhodothermales bacterium]|nr:ComF family protein [Rhodothermales bacterium]